MLTGIDHLVVAVPDLDAAIRSYRELGFTVGPGGRHPVATHNALVAFADGAYLELIAFDEPSPDHRWWAPLQQGGGLVDFCLRTDALQADTLAFRESGVDIDDPRPLSRVRPDGYRLRWVLSIPRGGYRGVVPFLIEDETPREERVPRETRHPNGVTGVRTVTVAVGDVGAIRRWYARAIGHPGEDIRRDDVRGDGVRFTVGPHRLELLTPRDGVSPLGEWLRRRGPSPWAATLAASGAPPGSLDPTRTLGARLTME
jgi:catechol 2,3-dioxygenase-like lactoylglutathione lyase family enzyme